MRQDFFETSDLVIWSLIAVMKPAQIFGALMGTRTMLGRGIVLIRPFGGVRLRSYGDQTCI